MTLSQRRLAGDGQVDSGLSGIPCMA